MGALEAALGGDAPRVDDPLRDALPGEVCDLLGVVVVLLEDQAARAHDERLVVIPHRRAGVRRRRLRIEACTCRDPSSFLFRQ